MREIVAPVILMFGIVVCFVALMGVFSFKFVINRMHCAAIIDSVGFFLIILGLILYSSDFAFIFKMLLVLLFQWVGSPIASHLVARLELETDSEADEHMKKGGYRKR